MPATRTKTIPRRVNFCENDADLMTAIMGELGFSTRYIQSHTRLTPCQVTYRLHKAAVKRTDYRNGDSMVALDVLRRMTQPLATDIRKKYAKQ